MISETNRFRVVSEKKESCGLFGIFGDEEAVQKTYIGLHSLQHRGQESAGIASSNSNLIRCHTGMGMIRRVFRGGSGLLEKLANPIAIGHVRYSTTGASKAVNSQPLLAGYSDGQVAVAHNGNLVNASLLRDEYEAYGSIFKSTCDTEIIIHLLAKPTHVTKPDPLGHVLNHLQGAYSLLFLFADRIEAARDPYGIRPLCIGQTEKGSFAVASETCALDAIEAKFIREVEPGEIVRLDKNGLSGRFFVKPGTITPAHCIFEHIYFAKQNSTIFGENVHEFRKKLGRQLAIDHPADADVVIPVPDSGTSAAIGYAEQSKLPFDMGMVRSHYIGRTFISPDQKLRELEVGLKLAMVKEVVRGKRVAVVDDSIVRGTTTRGKIRALRQAGAKEIHMRVSCPPIRYPCFYGIDFPTTEELLANNRNLKQIKEFLEVDSIGYQSLEGLLSCAALPKDHYCTACWTGKYKIPIDIAFNKFSMEHNQMYMFDEDSA
ncbi:MAG: amidophosphoribosyltransferase [Phycisphaerae bacterium]|nr:amidophosphoribosyltransferase [Phycisphaerae bacterium]NIP51201.1 amidophosphoribosyltransferase [Phycisphaerae bacterium]NIS50412.1 amidophosphoribosyltransferase [Phycisphaerae bacterium]NIU08142.1 amidophosphoribosyltransferase [Phycisphaerae bacterium]NIU55685.1 amidophosphoribosyltransferase [Phycisphaerae bacterium]